MVFKNIRVLMLWKKSRLSIGRVKVGSKVVKNCTLNREPVGTPFRESVKIHLTSFSAD